MRDRVGTLDPMHPTVTHLAEKPGAQFTFICRPCNRSKVYTGPELVARVGAEETFENLKSRMVCPKCRMPVDDEFRTFEFSAPQGMGGWSGPKV